MNCSVLHKAGSNIDRFAGSPHHQQQASSGVYSDIESDVRNMPLKVEFSVFVYEVEFRYD